MICEALLIVFDKKPNSFSGKFQCEGGDNCLKNQNSKKNAHYNGSGADVVGPSWLIRDL